MSKNKNKKETEKYLAKGQMIFVQTKDGLKENVFDEQYYLDDYKPKLGLTAKDYVMYLFDSKFTFDVYTLMSGKKFLKMISEGYITNDDGCICEIFANGFKTNLGIFTNNLISGEGCLLDEDAWKDMCDKYNIEVNWVNR